MKLSEKLDGVFYLLISVILFSFSFYSVYHAIFFERWSVLILSVFLFLFAITLALYGASRRLSLTKDHTYQKIFRYYLYTQLLTFLYLIVAGVILSLYLDYTYGLIILIGGITATIVCLLALYFSFKKEVKNRPESD